MAVTAVPGCIGMLASGFGTSDQVNHSREGSHHTVHTAPSIPVTKSLSYKGDFCHVAVTQLPAILMPGRTSNHFRNTR